MMLGEDHGHVVIDRVNGFEGRLLDPLDAGIGHRLAVEGDVVQVNLFMVPRLRGLRCGASPRQAVDDLVRLADDIAHDLARGLDVADQAAGLSRPKGQVLEVARVFRRGRQAGVFRDLHGLTGARSASHSRALARSLADRRPGGGLPLSNDGGTEDAMRRLLPADVEAVLPGAGVFGDAAYGALV